MSLRAPLYLEGHLFLNKRYNNYAINYKGRLEGIRYEQRRRRRTRGTSRSLCEVDDAL